MAVDDPFRKSATSKHISFIQPRLLPDVELKQLHCGILLRRMGYRSTKAASAEFSRGQQRMTEPNPDYFDMRRLEALSNTIFAVAMTFLAYDLLKAGQFKNLPTWTDLYRVYPNSWLASGRYAESGRSAAIHFR
jgi:hypothetical protein